MGIKNLLLSAMFLLSLYAQAGREVVQLEILQSGHYGGASKEDPYNYTTECKGWNPTKEQLMDYFVNAKEADSSEGWLHEYYSPCIATGKVTFKDESFGEWGIYDTGYGVVDFKDKANKTVKQKYFLNLKNGWDSK